MANGLGMQITSTSSVQECFQAAVLSVPQTPPLSLD